MRQTNFKNNAFAMMLLVLCLFIILSCKKNKQIEKSAFEYCNETVQLIKKLSEEQIERWNNNGWMGLVGIDPFGKRRLEIDESYKKAGEYVLQLDNQSLIAQNIIKIYEMLPQMEEKAFMFDSMGKFYAADEDKYRTMVIQYKNDMNNYLSKYQQLVKIINP